MQTQSILCKNTVGLSHAWQVHVHSATDFTICLARVYTKQMFKALPQFQSHLFFSFQSHLFQCMGSDTTIVTLAYHTSSLSAWFDVVGYVYF